jgi:hypothetical protein
METRRKGTEAPFPRDRFSMQARDFYEKRATELRALAGRAKSQDHRSDLLTLARAWRDLACVWEVERKTQDGDMTPRSATSPAHLRR